MRIIRYLRQCKVAVALIIALLVVQAFCDLSLPRYTSDIVNVGIQQSGITHASPDEMSQSTFEAVCMMSAAADEQTLRDAYAWDDATQTYKLTEQGAGERDALDGIVAFPLVAVHYADLAASAQGSDGQDDSAQARADAGQQGGFGGADILQTLSAYEAGLVSKDDVLAGIGEVKDALGANESLVEQQGVAAAKAEYTQLGRDVSGMQMSYLITCGAKMLGLTALGAVVAVGVGLLASRSAAKVARTLRGRLFERVVALSDAEVQRFSPASLITRGTNDIQQIQMTIVMLLRMVLYAPICAIGGIIMVSTTDVSMSWVIVLAVVVLLILVATLFAVTMPRFRVMQQLIDRVNLVAREMLTGLPVIRAFVRQDHEQKRFDKANSELMGTQLFTNRAMTFMMPSMTLVMNGVSVLIVWAGGHAIDAGTMQTGDMIAFLTYAMVIIMGFLMIGMVSVMLPRANVAAGRVDEVLAATSSVADPASPRDAELARTGGARVAFEDVTFHYPEADGSRAAEAALEHVSFTAEPGTVCAVIGSTGSGKSTVVKLIERFYDVTSGRVTIDGIDVRDLSQHALRSQLGYVPQQAFLFSGTVASNIGYGLDGTDAPDADARIREAAQVAQAAEFVEGREGAYDAPVAQGGTNVSGGQRQRLAIARAVATGARVLLFDDSFSALDYKTDAALRHALHDSLGDRTLIIVAQRISTVLDADQIVVLDEGRMVGCGTHAELMASCEAYQEIARSQLSEEELKGGEAR